MMWSIRFLTFINPFLDTTWLITFLVFKKYIGKFVCKLQEYFYPSSWLFHTYFQKLPFEVVKKVACLLNHTVTLKSVE